MKRIAVVNQRYGAEVNGGSEVYAREIAQRLSTIYNVDVITTTAQNYTTWENVYEAGRSQDGKVTIFRFPVARKRNTYGQSILSKILFHIPFHIPFLEKKWIEYQGPYSPEAVRYIEEKKDDYDAFIFVTYLYYLTAFGLPMVAEKSILIPTAHDEKPIWFRYYRELLTKPKALGFLTEEEKRFVASIADISGQFVSVIGSGVNVPNKKNKDQEDDRDIDSERFKKKYHISSRYIIYCGRVDASKGCDELFSYFRNYKKKTKSNLELIVLGKLAMPEPKGKDIHCFGFVSDKEKYDAMAGAETLALPSRYESLSLSVLESLSLGIPILVNGRCEVLKGHCKRSQAGLYYNNEKEFIEKLQIIDEKTPAYNAMKQNGPEYIKKYYSWNKTIEELSRMIEDISKNR